MTHTTLFQSTTVHLSAEWFDAVAEHPVMNPASFTAQSPAIPDSVEVINSLDAVIDAAVAVEHVFSPRLRTYASFRTDQSSRPSDTQRTIAVGAWDIHVLAFGATFRIRGSDFTLGVAYGFGSGSTTRVIDFLGQGSPSVLGGIEGTRVRYRSFRLVFGFGV